MEYKYQGWSEITGMEIKGIINASSKEMAQKHLEKKNIYVFSIAPVEALPQVSRTEAKPSSKEMATAVSDKTIDKALTGFKNISSRFKLFFNVPPDRIRVSKRTLNIFFLALTVTTKAGIPLVRALEAIKKQFIQTDRFGLIVQELLILISKGHTISSAMAKFPNAFSSHARTIVSAGEAGGDLQNTFSRLASSYESQARMEDFIKNALSYPLLVFLFSIGIVAGLCKFALPPFLDLFKGLAIPMPPLTTLFLKFISIISRIEFTIMFGLLLISAVIYARKQFELPEIRKKIELLFLHIPIIKTFFRALAANKFCQTLGELYASGVPLLKCLQSASAITGSCLLQENLQYISVKVIQGELLSQAVRETELFPRLVSQMIYIGETTGNMSFLLLKAAVYFQQEVATTAERVKQLIEPFILIFLGIVVALFVLIFFVPIYAALSQFG